MKKNYRKLEDSVISLFPINKKITWKGQQYTVLNSDKPTSTSKGEPKTDVYLKLQDNTTKETIELKISCKLEGSNEFQENKIKASRAKQIWGDNWRDILQNSALSIKEKFENTETYFPRGFGRTKETQYTNGWKVEIASKPRELAVKLELTDKDIRDKIYKGTTLDETKKNCLVNGVVIKNSGVAEYMLVTTLQEINSINKASDILNLLIPIDNYTILPHYIIFTGNNYRVLKNKHDGNRPLGVQVIWTANKDKNILEKCLKFDCPLDDNFSAKQIASRTKQEILKLGKSFTKNMI